MGKWEKREERGTDRLSPQDCNQRSEGRVPECLRTCLVKGITLPPKQMCMTMRGNKFQVAPDIIFQHGHSCDCNKVTDECFLNTRVSTRWVLFQNGWIAAVGQNSDTVLRLWLSTSEGIPKGLACLSQVLGHT